MNNLQGSGLTAIVEPAQKIVQPAQKHEGKLDSASERDSSPENLVETVVKPDSTTTVLSEGSPTHLKAAPECISSDLKLRSKENSPVAVLFDEERAQPQSQMVSTAKLLSMKESDSTKESDPTPNADSSGIPKELMPAVKAYRILAYRGTSQRGRINLIGAFLKYVETQKLSDGETLKLYQKLHSEVIQSPRLEDACIRITENFCSALTAFMPQGLGQKYEKQIAVIKLAADEYTEGLKRHLKELSQKLGSIELDSLANEAALVYFQKTFKACKEEAIPKEDQKALLKYVLKMKANAEFKFSTKFLLTILENPKDILGIAKDFLGGLGAKIAKDPKLSGLFHFVTDSVKHGLSLLDSDRTSPQV
jgi:hypothetical protein